MFSKQHGRSTLMRKSAPKPKTLTQQSLRGQEGINLIERIVLEMHSIWSPTGGTEVGIDGYIELFDQNTGAALGKTLAVQSKVQKNFANETDEGFDYYCDERDLVYWLQGNMPVLLIVSRPENNEAYWVSVKDYFSDSERQGHRRVCFSKSQNRFDVHAYGALVQLGGNEASGLHLGPLPLDETLFSNLLPLTSFPERIWVGPTEQRRPRVIWSILNENHPRVSGDWLLHDKSILSFQNLTQRPWSKICDLGATEDFDTSEWAYAVDMGRRRQFVQLLNLTLKYQLFPDVRWWPKLGCYMFVGDLTTAPIKIRYRSLNQEAEITVVSKYEATSKEGKDYVWLRHLAFRSQFRLFEEQWYLEITPSYVFTWDGKKQHKFHESRLSGIKRIEGNRAVLSQVLLWAQTLAQTDDFFRPVPKLRFGELLMHTLPIGIDDQGWVKGDPDVSPKDGEPDLFEPNRGLADET